MSWRDVPVLRSNKWGVTTRVIPGRITPISGPPNRRHNTLNHNHCFGHHRRSGQSVASPNRPYRRLGKLDSQCNRCTGSPTRLRSTTRTLHLWFSRTTPGTGRRNPAVVASSTARFSFMSASAIGRACLVFVGGYCFFRSPDGAGPLADDGPSTGWWPWPPWPWPASWR